MHGQSFCLCPQLRGQQTAPTAFYDPFGVVWRPQTQAACHVSQVGMVSRAIAPNA